MSDAAEFTERRRLWKDCLSGDDENSVRNQLAQLVWDAAAYRTINEARGYAPLAKDGGVELHPMLHNLLDNCFWDSQVLAVRRLSETIFPVSGAPEKTDKSVYSLGALLTDMKKHAYLFTRSNFFEAENIEYDLAVIEKLERSYCREQSQAGKRVFRVPLTADADRVHSLHELVDTLSYTDHKSRSPEDCVMPEVFDALLERMKTACVDIEIFATKFRAHAASPSSRASAEVDNLNLTLGKLFQAHECLCRTSNFIGVNLLRDGEFQYQSLLYPICDPLLYAERPLISVNKMDELRSFWDKQKLRVGKYEAWKFSELIPANSNSSSSYS